MLVFLFFYTSLDSNGLGKLDQYKSARQVESFSQTVLTHQNMGITFRKKAVKTSSYIYVEIHQSEHRDSILFFLEFTWF